MRSQKNLPVGYRASFCATPVASVQFTEEPRSFRTTRTGKITFCSTSISMETTARDWGRVTKQDGQGSLSECLICLLVPTQQIGSKSPKLSLELGSLVRRLQVGDRSNSR